MQEVQILRLDQLEKLTATLVEGQTATLKTLQQNANYMERVSDRLDEVSKRLDEVSNRVDEVSNRVEENSKRLDNLEKLVLRVLDELAIIREKLEPPNMGFAPSVDSG